MSFPDRQVPPIQLFSMTINVNPLHSELNPILNVLPIPGIAPHISGLFPVPCCYLKEMLANTGCSPLNAVLTFIPLL